MYTIFDIAFWFRKKKRNDMTQKKIQKLCYYAQAWSMALYNKPLIDCKFEAWAHGPVCRELWEQLKVHTYYNVPIEPLRKLKTTPIRKEEDKSFLERVWSTYGKFDGYQLEILTHKEQPWIKARGNTPEMQRCTNVISNEDMRDYYITLYAGDGVSE